jgi:thiamine biosynthesis lipoprotein
MGCEIVVAGASADEERAVRALFDERDARFSRFRPDSELSSVNRARVDPVLVSPAFARAVRDACRAAAATGGVVTPAIGAAVAAAGYDVDFSRLGDDERPAGGAAVPPWRRLRLAGRLLTRGGICLDLNGVVKGAAVDDALAILARGGTVSAGGDVATTRPVDVELPGSDVIALHAGGLATSGTDKRRWRRAGEEQHHLIDTTTGRPARSPWRQVTVAAGSCLAADIAAKAALLLAHAGPSWLDRRGLPGRFVDERGVVHLNQSWTSRAARAAA